MNKQTHKQTFHGIVPGFPRTVPGLSRDCPGKSLTFPGSCVFVFSFSPRKRQHISNKAPLHPFAGQSRNVVCVCCLLVPHSEERKISPSFFRQTFSRGHPRGTSAPQCLFFWQAPKSTRKRNKPKNAGNRPFPESGLSGVLRFRVCFGALLEGNKEHPKTQHTRKRRFWEQSITCVFGCAAFSGACSPLINFCFQDLGCLTEVFGRIS